MLALVVVVHPLVRRDLLRHRRESRRWHLHCAQQGSTACARGPHPTDAADGPFAHEFAVGVQHLVGAPAAMVRDLLTELDELDVTLHVADVKGPVRDVLHRAGIWEELAGRIHTSTHDAVRAIVGDRPAPSNQRLLGIDERHGTPLGVHDPSR